MRTDRVAAGSVEARVLVALYMDEIARTFPDGFDPEASVPVEPAEFSPPRGAFLVVRADDGNAIGCGGVRLLDPQTAEIKRMWVDPAARGQGAGRVLLTALEDAARDLGATRACLDTNELLVSALALYRGAGWAEVPAYNDNAYATHWLDKQL
jgi:GNAT superfamily N-acetyltransferase